MGGTSQVSPDATAVPRGLLHADPQQETVLIRKRFLYLLCTLETGPVTLGVIGIWGQISLSEGRVVHCGTCSSNPGLHPQMPVALPENQNVSRHFPVSSGRSSPCCKPLLPVSRALLKNQARIPSSRCLSVRWPFSSSTVPAWFLPLSGFVIFDKGPDLSEPRFPHVHNQGKTLLGRW